MKISQILLLPFRLVTWLFMMPLLGGPAAYRRDQAKMRKSQQLFCDLFFGIVIITAAVLIILDVAHYIKYGTTLFGALN